VSGVVPTRPGYTFAGWLYNTVIYFGGDSFVMPSTGVTLVAQWTDDSIPTFVVVYDVAGGVGAPVDSTQYAPGASVTVSGVVPTRPGYTFAGWLYDGIIYTAGQSFTMSDVAVTLVAQWTPNPTFAVVYDEAGGVGVPDTGLHEPGVSVTVSSVVPTRPGYTFAGWLYNTVIYTAGQSFTMPSAVVTLVAQWTPNPTFVVVYDAAGGSGVPDTGLHESGISVTVSGVVPTRAGYAFAGWLYNGVIYFGGDSFVMPANNVKITAQWIDNTLASTVIYNANGGANAPIDSHSPYASGMTVTVLGQGSITRSGYTFNGWAVNSTTGRIYAAGESFTITGNTILYALWTETSSTNPGGNNGSGSGNGGGSESSSSQSNSTPSSTPTSTPTPTPTPTAVPTLSPTPTSSGSISGDEEPGFWSFWRIVLVVCIVLGVSAVLAVVGVTDGLLPKKRVFVA
jgi:uncharacterized repeat protein (TIGR02543 family)